MRQLKTASKILYRILTPTIDKEPKRLFVNSWGEKKAELCHRPSLRFEILFSFFPLLNYLLLKIKIPPEHCSEGDCYYTIHTIKPSIEKMGIDSDKKIWYSKIDLAYDLKVYGDCFYRRVL